MMRCSRCCLHTSMRIMNIFVTLCGVGMIIYSLWLLQKWHDGVSQLLVVSPLQPWFIYTCLGMGILVCFNSLCGHVAAARNSNSSLCIFIASICSLVLLQAVVVVAVMFKIDWEMKISLYIDEKHKKFERFLRFHISVCRFITVLVLVAQANVVVLAILLWATGTHPRGHCNRPEGRERPSYTHSFLVSPGEAIAGRPSGILSNGHSQSSLLCSKEEDSESCVSYIKNVFQGRTLS